MTNDKGILIKNIYYMLTYAFQSLRQSNYDSVATEDFENIHDMFAAILGKGVANQLKQGLYKEYILQSEELSVLRGKLNLQGTIKNRTQHRQKLACEYDELSENNLLNRILKTTIMILIRQKTVKPDRKVLLKKNLILLFLLLAGVMFGSLLAAATRNIPWLTWLSYGQTVGISVDNPMILDLAVIQLAFGFELGINIAQIICVLIAIFAYKGLVSRL